MKKLRISAAVMALCLMSGVCLSGCKSSEYAATSDTSVSGASQSDSGLTLPIDTGAGTPDGSSTDTTMMKMTYQNNYDAGAIAEMNKTVKIHGIQFTTLDYNYYFANEYVQLMTTSYGSLPMTAAGFIDMNGNLTEDKKVREYMGEQVIFDLQGEAFLLDYAQKNNLEVDEEILQKIEDTFKDTEQTAAGYGMTLDEYLQAWYGPEANVEGMRSVLQRYELINLSMKHYVEEYHFEEGETLLPTVYHVLFPTISLETGAKLSDEEVATAKQRAEDFRNSINGYEDMQTKAEAAISAGEAVEAREYTVQLGQMVKEFEEWCFAEHNVGDVDVVETKYGYHVIYFVGRQEADEKQRSEIAYKQFQAEMDEAVASEDYAPEFS
ncbi:MAG: peptidylprolyl isomerase [Clostridiales bacterium]|nr:peptidylprolyl isomerase [Clostridiales bacterium]MBR4009564.1 peptidylprolyl isomerase [Clostridiales bacterium]